MNTGVRTENWAGCDAVVARSLIQQEIRGYLDDLRWDVTAPWAVVEPARRSGQLPGLVARDEAGQLRGWTAYLPLEGHLQVMTITASDTCATAVLVEGIVSSPEARRCRSVIVCVRDGAPGLASALDARGFAVEPYRYLVRTLASGADVPATGDAGTRSVAWRGRRDAMARLCQRAYRDSGGIRAFAPDGTLQQWRSYVDTLIDGTGCGTFLPRLSRVVPDDADGRADRLLAGVMLSDLGTGTVHVAQVAVDPAAGRPGRARPLGAAAPGAPRRRDATAPRRRTAANTSAARLYESLGFRDHASFIVAQQYRW